MRITWKNLASYVYSQMSVTDQRQFYKFFFENFIVRHAYYGVDRAP